jgi:hypothetical protein
MSEIVDSNGEPHGSSTYRRNRTDRRWWRYNGALAPRDARVRAARRPHDSQQGR